METGKEAVLFNSDTLSKIILYLPSIDLLNLALTSKRFSVSNNTNDVSIIEESARIAIREIATEDELATLPYYNGENLLADYHYLQLLRAPLAFDQLVEGAEYVNKADKSCVTYRKTNKSGLATAFSNSILRAGKHYATFGLDSSQRGDRGTIGVIVGLMRPGKATHKASGLPLHEDFFQNYSRNMVHGECNNSIQCCLYNSDNANCIVSDWKGSTKVEYWDGLERNSDGEIGMLLDLDEGTLSVYKNGRKLGVMKRGLAGPYCWVVSLFRGVQVTIKRGTIPPS